MCLRVIIIFHSLDFSFRMSRNRSVMYVYRASKKKRKKDISRVFLHS